MESLTKLEPTFRDFNTGRTDGTLSKGGLLKDSMNGTIKTSAATGVVVDSIQKGMSNPVLNVASSNEL